MTGYTALRDGRSLQMRQNFRNRFLALTPKQVQKTVEKHLLKQVEKGIAVTFAGKELLDKEPPLIEDKKLEILQL